MAPAIEIINNSNTQPPFLSKSYDSFSKSASTGFSKDSISFSTFGPHSHISLNKETVCVKSETLSGLNLNLI